MVNIASVDGLRNEDIILVSNQMLEDRYWTSKQYITQELRQQNRVLYVEANYSFGKLFLGIFRGTWPVLPFGKLKQLDGKFWVLTPFPRLPLRNHVRFMGWLNQYLLKRKLRAAVKTIGMQNVLFWTFLHQTADLVDAFSAKATIYHCVDDWPALIPMAGMGTPRVVQRDEDRLLNTVDVVFRVSAKLLKGREPVHVPVYDIPNGVDTGLFKPIGEGEMPPLDDLDGLPGPIIGFSGSIGAWVDVDLIQRVADTFTHGSVVLIGLNEKNPRLEKLLQTENVHFLGMKKRKDVPFYLAKFDVCLMPFDKGQVGEGLLPLKMFEYLALGKPVVAITSTAMEAFQDVLYSADDAESFVEKIKVALAEETTEFTEARIQRAHEYSWKRRVELYSEAIKTVLG